MNGSELWSYPTGDWITDTPAVTNGRVYIESWDDIMYCLNATTGSLVLDYFTGGGIDSSPAVADGNVYFGSSDQKMYCLDAETGESIWEYTTGWQINSSPAIAEGKVYVGSMDYNVYCFGSGNQPPVFGPPTPADGSTNNPVSLTWSIPIDDPEGDLFSWAIQCSNGQTNGDSDASNGTKTLDLSGLAFSTTYKVWVNATDKDGSGQYTKRWYTFTTEDKNQPPSFGVPIPTNGSTNQLLNLTWSIPISDPNGDLS
ncbi:MAG TPA: PQQ-binding-like beta-propeller repeat protein [Candidatus Thermoplasmatota archaeon]|nr:PQQ-binding-like beta-propeller repeat protein [Candidatus Thermoplasmatota archaeon]